MIVLIGSLKKILSTVFTYMKDVKIVFFQMNVRKLIF